MSVREQVRVRMVLLRARVESFFRGSPARWRYPVAATLLLILVPVYVLFTPAQAFPKGELISIPVDSTSIDIANQLAAQHVVHSALQFRLYTRITGQDRALQSGIYVFDHPLGMAGVAGRLAAGEHGIDEARVTLTEGMTNDDMAQAIAAQVPGFDSTAFLRDASTSEGYLFPDTYFILPGTTPEDLLQRLRSRFDTKIATIQPEIDAFGESLHDDVTVASILEREAQDPEDMRIIAGIFYNRIRIGMPLQVDAAFGYAHGKNGYTPTAADLASDSPYNTYRFRGLTPTPISNPGLDALRAAVTPVKTDYLYYLTGRDGKMHYAKTFEEHKANRVKYLD